MKKTEEELQLIQVCYDIIFGQSYVMRPRPSIEIRPNEIFFDAKTAQSMYAMQRKNNGKNR